jgi:adenylosuccinate lyase
VKAGADRQEVHEAIRRATHAAARALKEGGESTIRERLAAEPVLAGVAGRLDDLLDGSLHVGRAPQQVEEFLREEVDPLLARHRELAGVEGEVRV